MMLEAGQKLIILVAEGAADPRNATSLEDGEISLKLNKRGSQAIWMFDIRGRVSVSVPRRLYLCHLQS
jgi:hypothetical protein